MKIAFIINSHETEQVKYTTPTIGYAAYKRGHDVFYIGVGELGYASDGNLIGMGKTITDRIELVRHIFRRAIEVWLVLDRVLYLQLAGYDVQFNEFCDKKLTPRNILIQATL